MITALGLVILVAAVFGAATWLGRRRVERIERDEDRRRAQRYGGLS